MLATGDRSLVLASASASRRRLLEAAGMGAEVVPADIDEPAVRDALLAADPAASPGAIALALARAKAELVLAQRPRAIVIGADQVLALGNRIFAKPCDSGEAADHLRALRGCRHALHSAVAVAIDGSHTWTALETAQLTMRPFSDAFLAKYLAEAGPGVLSAVGAYHLEGLGIQLFERIEGDYFTILGLPLLPLVRHLRTLGVLVT